MLALAVRLLLLGTPVLSEADLRIAERLAWRAGVPKGAVESLSTDVTGDGAPDVVLLTRTGDRLVLFVAEGPVSPVGRWWRVDLHRGTGAGDGIGDADDKCFGVADVIAEAEIVCGINGGGVTAEGAAGDTGESRKADYVGVWQRGGDGVDGKGG